MMNQEVKDMFNEVILSGRLGKLEHLQLRGDPETDNCKCILMWQAVTTVKRQKNSIQTGFIVKRGVI